MAIYQLSWNAPTTRIDASPLPLEEIRGYIVRRLYNSVTTEHEAETTLLLLDVGVEPAGTLTVAAVDLVGTMSTFVPVPSVTLYNNPPTINSTELKSITIKFTATDADGDSITYSILSQGTKGTSSVVNSSTGIIKYTPTQGQTGTDAFTVRLTDSRIGGIVDTVVTMNLTTWTFSTALSNTTITRS